MQIREVLLCSKLEIMCIWRYPQWGEYKGLEWSENLLIGISDHIRSLHEKGLVAYKLQLPPEMKAVFSVFHVSQLKKCLHVPEETIEPASVKIQSDLTYKERPIRVLEEMERVTYSKVIKFYKVVWNNHSD